MTQQPQLDNRAHVAPELSEERLASVWFNLSSEQRRRSQRTRRGMFVAAGALAAAAAALLVVWRVMPAAPDQWAGTVLRTAKTPMQVALADGSTIKAQPATELQLLSGSKTQVRFALRRGKAAFEVARDKKRDFIVEAGDVRVRVVGTRFSVARAAAGNGVEVVVARGIVEVRDGQGKTLRLSAGQRWSRGVNLALASPAKQPPSPPVPPAPPRVEPPDDGTRGGDAESKPPQRRRSRSRGAPSAAKLFEQATALRRAAKHHAAERAYRRFLARYGGDARAPLVAFELGRLRMDQLGDARGAVRALRRVLRSKRAVLREDALARLVLLYGRLGDKRACGRSKARYVRLYPHGRYAAHLADRCR
ncbi:MAG: FecR domain-containing protein [Myxococcales bacterium]|nr:FecR domain-containing protein [Myxococcales bacterium]